MDLKIAGVKLTQTQKQRNFFVILSLLLSASIFSLTIALVLREQKVILVPGLQQEVWTSDHQVSSSYLEETTMMYLPLLLDLEPQTIEWKRDRILAYVARTDGNYLQQLQDYFARAKEEYSKFGLRTHFAVKKLTVDESKLEVIAEGLLISLFGDYGTDSRQAHYLLRFDWVGGKLLIKEFKKITEEKLG